MAEEEPSPLTLSGEVTRRLRWRPHNRKVTNDDFEGQRKRLKQEGFDAAKVDRGVDWAKVTWAAGQFGSKVQKAFFGPSVPEGFISKLAERLRKRTGLPAKHVEDGMALALMWARQYYLDKLDSYDSGRQTLESIKGTPRSSDKLVRELEDAVKGIRPRKHEHLIEADLALIKLARGDFHELIYNRKFEAVHKDTVKGYHERLQGLGFTKAAADHAVRLLQVPRRKVSAW